MKTAYQIIRARAMALETYVRLLKELNSFMTSGCFCGDCETCTGEDMAIAKLAKFERENPMIRIE